MHARLIAVLAFVLFGTPPAHALSLWEQPRYAAILVNANSGEVLYERRADLARHPASITKVMTLYLAFDAMGRGQLRPGEAIPISAHAASQPPSKLGLRAGQSLPVEDAVRVIAVKSANDIAVALAECLGGSEAAFVRMMNAKAAALGMVNTHFVNASGLPDPAHVTTARDLATLSRALLRDHADRYAYFSQPDFAWRGKLMMNHNHLLGLVDGVDGIKTGYTASSGYTLAASAIRGGQRLIAIVLGSPTGRLRDANVADLLDAGFGVLRDRLSGGRMTVSQALGEDGSSQPLLGPGIAWGVAPRAAAPVGYSAHALGAMRMLAKAAADDREDERER